MAGVSEESDFRMPLPEGGSLHARRRVRPLSDGFTWIEEEMEVDGRLSGAFATGPGWIFELHTITAGAVSFLQDGVRLPIAGPRFGLFYAPYSITAVQFENVRTRWVGVAGQSNAGAESLVLDIGTESRASNPAELLTLLSGPREARSLECCTRPSPLLRGARTAFDASHRRAPSIAAVAKDLGVSHAYLTREFKRAFGLTPMAYRHALRASEAAGRLSRGEPVVDVSGEAGYEDLGRFYKAFRNAVHASPGAYRIPAAASKSAKAGR